MISFFFDVYSLMDIGDPEVTKTVKRALKPVQTSLGQMKFKGAEILASKLKG